MTSPVDDDLPDLDPALLARAENALSALAGDYLIWVDRDCAAARACLTELENAADPVPPLAKLAGLVHDMKGQAATFGYPLISRIGAALLHELQHGEDDPAVLKRYVNALCDAAEQRLTGDGGERGREILDRLD